MISVLFYWSIRYAKLIYLQMTQKLQELLLKKQYEAIPDELKRVSPSSPESRLLIQLTKIRHSLWEQTSIEKQPADFNKHQGIIIETCNQYSKTINEGALLVYQYSMQAFLFEIETDCNDGSDKKEELERKFVKDLTRLPDLISLMAEPSFKGLVQNSLFFTVSLLELYVKKNTRIKNNSQRTQLNLLGQLIQQMCSRERQSLLLWKRLYMIIIHLKLHNLNTFSVDLEEQIVEYMDLCIRATENSKMVKKSTGNHSKMSQGNILPNEEETLISSDTVVVLLYTCLKIMVGLNELSPLLVSRLATLYKIFNLNNVMKSYSSHILHMFFIIKILIFQEKQSEGDKGDRIQEKLSEFSQKFSIFLNINLDEIIVALNEITRNIIRHKVASLSTIIGTKLDIFRFSKDFLEIMHDSPFNNDVQTIKLCFELFEFKEYQKIQNLLQIVLSAPATKQLKMREVLVAMCSILTGLRLSHREQALLYNKLNHENFLSTKSTNKTSLKSEILKQETFLQHVGFGYYNMACHQVYLENREIYLIKAVENFNRSYELNKENYLLNYCLAKAYLQLYDLPNAYKHAMEACRSHRGAWAPFCLLACVYMCDRKFHKSFLLIEELLKKYTDQPVLHYTRAYLEVNKILLEVEHDEEIEAAKMLGEEYYTTHFERLLKHKPMTTLIQYCQSYYQLWLKQPLTDPEENFFSSQSVANETDNIAPLLNILPLLWQVHQYSTVESILKILPASNIEVQHYKCLLLLRRKETKEAVHQLEAILKLNQCHTATLLKLSQLPRSHDQTSYKQCMEYIEMAGNYINDSDFMLAKGMVLSWLGDYDEADKALLENRDVGWCAMLPDLLYYY